MDFNARNVLGTSLRRCGVDSLPTGYMRTGYCVAVAGDYGRHVIASVVTQEFLQFTKSKGNDLITPRELYSFPGLKPGDRWCLCAGRWKEAYEAGAAPPVLLQCTHESALKVVTLDMLKEHALDLPEDN
jgi:uncharacterized protein (DUF2237 family)